ncbi:MAG: Ig-like domain-containing protein [Clostridium sp.]|nr:Ig-like domain-containing protein [Clostridium sp.]
MKKRIMSLALTVVLLFALCIDVIPSRAAVQTLTITATVDKQTVKPGDTVTVTVSMGPVTDLAAVWIRVSIPEGLTYVSGSKNILDYAYNILECDARSFTESSMIFFANPINRYTSAESMNIFTIQCTVDETATGNLTIGFEPDSDENCYTGDDPYNPDICTCDFKTATVSVVIPATGITLNKNSVTLNAGDTETLTATLTPANATDTVVWSTSNSAVADVDAATGEVTAKKKGTANITATAGTKTAACAVTVNCPHANKTNVAAESSSCTKKGWTAYSKCDACGQLFDGSNDEITEIPYLSLAEHTEATAAACNKLATCSVCGQSYGNYAEHTYGSLIPEVAATHSSEGTKAHYECSVCGKIFNSSKVEVTEQDLIIDMIPHVPGDWQTDETNHWKNCTTVGCGVLIESTKTAHTYKWVVDKAATEDETGLKHEECTACGYTRNENTVIDKLDHVHVDIVKHAAVAASCTKTGTVEYYTCGSSKCDGKYYSDEACQLEITNIVTDVNPENHVGEVEIKNQKDATADEEGYTGDTYCKACGEKIADGESFKAEAEVKIAAISEADITDELKKAGIDTVAKIEEALYAIALTDNYKKENSVVYDAKLMVSFDNGKTFVEATKDNYPVGGKIAVTIPYPNGTDATYDFKVVHMFATSVNGQTPGSMEIPEITKTATGITFEVNGLSPISVSWYKEAPQPEVVKPETATDKTISESPKTGDSVNVSVMILLVILSGILLVIMTRFIKKEENRLKE